MKSTTPARPPGRSTPDAANTPLSKMEDFLTLQSAIDAIDEATSAVANEVERDRLGEATLARLSTVEAELKRSRLALEKIIREESN